MIRDGHWFTYLVRCSDSSLRPGSTDDLLGKVRDLNSGRGSRRAASRSPVAIVWSRAFPSKVEAVREEIRLKGVSDHDMEASLAWPCPTSSITLANPLLSLFHRAYPPPPEGLSLVGREEWGRLLEKEETFHGLTRDAASHYSWGVPTEKVIRMIASLGPLVEMGAGNGYWAMLLSKVGSDIIAFDEKPTWSRLRSLADQNPWMAMGVRHGKVRRGRPEDLRRMSERTLLLCWPPKDDPMAIDSLMAWGGDRIVLVGPRKYVGSDEFYDELQKNYVLRHDEPLPSWPECEDSAQFWVRSESSSATNKS